MVLSTLTLRCCYPIHPQWDIRLRQSSSAGSSPSLRSDPRPTRVPTLLAPSMRSPAKLSFVVLVSVFRVASVLGPLTTSNQRFMLLDIYLGHLPLYALTFLYNNDTFVVSDKRHVRTSDEEYVALSSGSRHYACFEIVIDLHNCSRIVR